MVDSQEKIYELAKNIGMLNNFINIFITTDNEYLISAFNNLIYAAKIDYDDIIPKKYWITNVEAFLITKNKRFNIINSDDGLIDYRYFHEAYLGEIDNDYDQMFIKANKIQPKTSVQQLLKNAIDVFEHKNFQYGNSYYKIGEMLSTLYPEGVTLKTVKDFTIWSVFIQIVFKLIRTANTCLTDNDEYVFAKFDSPFDASVYNMMLLEVIHKFNS
jgi:hypothetical protein